VLGEDGLPILGEDGAPILANPPEEAEQSEQPN